MKRQRRAAVLRAAGALLLIGLTGAVSSAHAAGTLLRLHGSLVKLPCVLRAGDENITMGLFSTSPKYFYTNTRTPSQVFQLHLDECDLTLGENEVKVSFTGPEDAPALPGFLRITSTTASGIGVGIEDDHHHLMPLNQGAGDATPLADGHTIMTVYAFMQGEPEAIRNRSITPGQFTAVAGFTLSYD